MGEGGSEEGGRALPGREGRGPTAVGVLLSVGVRNRLEEHKQVNSTPVETAPRTATAVVCWCPCLVRSNHANGCAPRGPTTMDQANGNNPNRLIEEETGTGSMMSPICSHERAC